MHHVAYWLGLTNPSGGPYLFWSGFGGDASKIAGLVWLGRFFKKHHHHGGSSATGSQPTTSESPSDS